MRRALCVPMCARGALALSNESNDEKSHTRDTPPVYVHFFVCVCRPWRVFYFLKRGCSLDHVFFFLLSRREFALSTPLPHYTWKTSVKAAENTKLIFSRVPLEAKKSNNLFPPPPPPPPPPFGLAERNISFAPALNNFVNEPAKPFIIWYSN